MARTMARAKLLMCALCLILVQLQGTQGTTIEGVGVNWGALASHPMEPAIVVNMLKSNGIKKVKLFDSDSWTVSAFSNTDIEVMVGIPNDQLSKIAGSSGDAEDWVKANLTKHFGDRGVNIRYVSVGNEPFLSSYNGSFIKTTFPAMQNIQKAIDKFGLGDKVKVTTAMNADVYESSSNKPSDGIFKRQTYDEMIQIVRFLNEKNAPFVVNIYPFLNIYQNKDFPEELAFFDGGGKTIDDKNVQYSNVFDANLDTLMWSLKKAGYPDVKIMVGEVGWPTDGHISANPKNAKRFYQGFLKKMASKKGSPLHPEPFDVYLFSLFDEDLKSIAPGNFERHWGIFRYDGRSKFPIDFSGQGQENWPEEAKGVRYQENKWCVLNSDVKDMSLVPAALDYACALADCTSLGYGCSCANLDLRGNTSFAFNQYFQIKDQSVEACDFNGLGNIVTEDPSNGSCLFPIEIESSKSGLMIKAMHTMGALLIGLSAFFLTFP
ncbi:hypothetical protein Lal_00001874 [Lupinus albus]|uniref:glucan endo-1,3-beta-D-glucosidase n=1 Tax=Lupinus albus TaxID=3870 RepID=A0A6A5P710_LUPAL|nr:putative glucan endo-1,3-beta-D-glucosidase [Lupinus albus]KAF1893404.1 hypothetical protein Lal_00001874 [Lupinus albus]